MKTKNTIVAVMTFCLIFVSALNGQTDGLTTASNRQSEADKPLKIIKKPVARDWKCSQEAGLTKLRATFEKTAKVSSVEVLESSGCASFDEEAIRVARKIKFEPAIKNGEAVTTIKSLQYSFYIR